MQSRKKYSKEFKLDAVSLVKDQGYSRAEAARSLGVNSNMLGRWVKELDQGDGQVFRGNGRLTVEQEEIRQLREENRRLKMEKEILKKATFLFSRCSLYGSIILIILEKIMSYAKEAEVLSTRCAGSRCPTRPQ